MKKYAKYLLLLVITIILLPISVKAEEQISLGIDKDTLEVGDEVVVTANLSSNKKLYALTASFSYDKNVFMEINNNDFVTNDDITTIYNTENNRFGIINKTGAVEEELFTIHLRVRDNAKVGDTYIYLNDISISDGNTKKDLDSDSLKVLVVRDAKNDEVLPINHEQNTNEEKKEPIKVFTTVPVIVVLAIVGLGLIITIIYLFLKRKDKKNLMFVLIGALVLVGVATTSLIIINNKKQDVNDDGKEDYEDAEEIIKYLIDYEGTNTDKKKENTKNKFGFDVNNDGRVDVNDAGSSTSHTTEKVNYTVKLKEVTPDNVYVERGTITLDFTATIKPSGRKIKSVKINGKEYPVSLKNSIYSVRIDTPNQAGVCNFKISKVKLDNNREINSSLSFTREVLKTKPYVDLFSIDDENNKLKFQLEDKDGAFESGYILITDEKGTEALKENIVVGANNFDHEFEKDKDYVIYVYATYDRDSNKLNNITGEMNNYEDDNIYTHSLLVTKNYDFIVKNVSITDAISKGDKVEITFESTNSKNIPVETVVINGEEYKVTPTEKDNQYKVILNQDTSYFGKFHLNIEKIGLKNLKVFENKTDYDLESLGYTVLKNLPEANSIQLEEDKENKNINVSYDFKDLDDTYKDLTVELIDSTNKIVTSKEVSKENLGKDLALSYEGNYDGRYVVKFLVDCDLGTERHIYKDKNIGEKEILTQQDIKIAKYEVNTLFPQKNQKKYQIKYYIEFSPNIISQDNNGNDNGIIVNGVRYTDLAGITINGLNYDGSTGSVTEKVDNKVKLKYYTVVVNFTIPDESGLLNIKVDRIKLRYEDYNNRRQAFFSLPSYSFDIDVLKDEPTINNLEIKDENYDEGKATFEFDVVSDKGGFTGGSIDLNGINKSIEEGHNKVTLEEIKQDENYTLEFHGNYELDTNKLDAEDNKNTFTDQIIYSIPYGLYSADKYKDISLDELEVISKKNNKYFEKNENIKLHFNVSGISEDLDLSISKIVIANKEYEVKESNNKYQIVLDSYTNAGEKTLTIDSVVLSNGKKVVLTEPVIVTFEVLKDHLTMNDFRYEKDKDKINLFFDLKDNDNAIINTTKDDIKVKIYDEDGKELQVLDFADKLTINAELDRYYVKVYAKYDRDVNRSDNINRYEDVLLLNETVSIDSNYIELTNIEEITLYTEENARMIAIENVSIEELKNNKNSYFVKISMNGKPTVYAKIKDVLVVNGRVILVLDYQYVTDSNSNDEEDLRIDFGSVQEDDTVSNETNYITFAKLIEKIKKEPNSNINLTNDINASEVTSSEASYIDNFSGTINGNGHKITGMNKQLFRTLDDGATIKNLVIESASVSGPVRGIIANTATNTTIENVHIINSNINANNSSDGTGIMFGDTRTSIKITKSSIINSSVIGGKRTGGFIGFAYNKLTMEDSYIMNSKVTGSSDAKGALVGEMGSVNLININRCYANAEMNDSNGTAKSGFIGYTGYGGSRKISNSVSLVDGNNGNRVSVGGAGVTFENCYELKESKMNSNQNGTTIKEISKDEINLEFFKSLGFNEEVWNLDGVSFTKLPMINGEDYSTFDANKFGDDYDEKKETLYNNLIRLMPFYKLEKIGRTASKIPETSNLYKKELMHIVPVDAKGHIVTYLTTTDQNKITKIKLVYADGTSETYDVRYDKTYDMVASYRINDLKIDYTYNHYVIDSKSQLVNNLTNYLLNLSYEENLDKLTPSIVDSRIYKEHYSDVTRKEMKEFVLKFLSNSNYTNTTNDEMINDYLEEEIKKDQKIEKVLYVYNYFRRFYSLDIDGMMLNDFVLFNMEGFGKNLTPLAIAEMFLSNDKNIESNRTSEVFVNILGSKTNSNSITDFIEYVVTNFSDEDVDEWCKKTFKGYIVEISITGQPDIQYTLWDHLSTKDIRGWSWANYTLPILTLPKNAGYVISSPTQFIIGSERIYMVDPNDSEQQANFARKVKSYTDRMQDYYDTSYNILLDKQLFNNIHTFQIDKRFAFDDSGVQIFQNPEATTDPFHKNFNEVVNLWANPDGNAATANGSSILWRAEGVLESNFLPDATNHTENTFHTWSHETAHNIDARLFLRDKGRRFDAGGEDYADGNLSQSFGPNEIVMNLSVRYDPNTKMGANPVPSMIASPTKVENYYKEVFKTIYVMDYIEAMAFLQLDDNTKSGVAVQVSYPNYEKYYNDVYSRFRARQSTRFTYLDSNQFKEMKLETIDDLIKNKIVLEPGIYQIGTRGSNLYGGQGIGSVHWYQPNNPDGRPDSYSLKWIAYEMLGYKGYDEGYIAYYSNINSKKQRIYTSIDEPAKGTTEVDFKSDSMALYDITDGQFSNFDNYKKYRFNETRDNLEKLDKDVVDVKDYIQKFQEALQKDAENYSVKLKDYMAKNPGCINDYWCRVYNINPLIGLTESTKVRQDLYYALKEATNNFTTDIFEDTKQQDLDDILLKKSEYVEEEPTEEDSPKEENSILIQDTPLVSDDITDPEVSDGPDKKDEPEVADNPKDNTSEEIIEDQNDSTETTGEEQEEIEEDTDIEEKQEEQDETLDDSSNEDAVIDELIDSVLGE